MAQLRSLTAAIRHRLMTAVDLSCGHCDIIHSIDVLPVTPEPHMIISCLKRHTQGVVRLHEEHRHSCLPNERRDTCLSSR